MEAWYHRGVVKAKLGDTDSARSDLTTAKQLAENSGNNEFMIIIDAALSELDDGDSGGE